MTHEEFEQLVAEEFERAIPEGFLPHIKNVAFLVEDEPSQELRKKEGLEHGETLLGYYHGIPLSARGDWYGMGTTMPDTITLFQKPIEEQAHELEHSNILQNVRISYTDLVRKIIRETIWHEVAHHFGFDENQVQQKEQKRDGKGSS